MFVVSRFEVADDKVEEVMVELQQFLDSMLRKHTKTVLEVSATPYEQANQRAAVYSLYETEEPTPYSEVVALFADDSGGDADLLETALDGLRDDVQARPEYIGLDLNELLRIDEKRGLYGGQEDIAN